MSQEQKIQNLFDAPSSQAAKEAKETAPIKIESQQHKVSSLLGWLKKDKKPLKEQQKQQIEKKVNPFLVDPSPSVGLQMRDALFGKSPDSPQKQQRKKSIVVRVGSDIDYSLEKQLINSLHLIPKHTLDEELQEQRQQKQQKSNHNLFYISPSYKQLTVYPLLQLNKIKGLKIWNAFGQIIFLEEVSLKDVNLERIIIAQNTIKILTNSLKSKKKQLLYHNYLNYANLAFKEKKTLKAKIVLEKKSQSLKIVYHSQLNGDLLVE